MASQKPAGRTRAADHNLDGTSLDSQTWYRSSPYNSLRYLSLDFLITWVAILEMLIFAKGKAVAAVGKLLLDHQLGLPLFFLLLLSLAYYCKRKKTSLKKRFVSSLEDPATEVAHCFTLAELEEATKDFEKKVGSGGFGVVYYGKLKDGKEIVVKVLTNNSFQGKLEFSNEVALLSRIHHRNLVQFLRFCTEDGKSILVYEFMHNGPLKEHLYGTQIPDRSIK
ncbi:putative LRR receptor-like serine/threonine-protein kinase [Capsicum baccatum]|uniref:LRR receptor-like serine/threonine-protein kinase n=1 Tax=Capsicum baccatum TaxID=33114 RepID=A0A2G2XLH7_CAPBA|nr:putative LRR receptor-like serine/threonine-protein kinase [Capsicum baccatum]